MATKIATKIALRSQVPFMTEKHTERMQRFLDAGIYFVTSQSVSEGRTTPQVVRAALAGGIRLVQLREKTLPGSELFKLAVEIRELTSSVGSLFIVNDRLDVALACGADGVHLGQEDLPGR